MDERLLTIKEVADYLQVNERTVMRYINSGEITSIKFGGQRRISKQAVEDFINRHTTTPTNKGDQSND
ncbi:DNA-binding protein [Exiguobacterium sp. RIT452]|uniref:helix-turn-helix domain-containing protein n=1 Tax=Exiguobacterium sp. RIT452 TaxID=2315552 RepID=UPI000E74F4F1|nr:helix-turn-helix domain-containing protein [Exiguobacterium sp. RIT452]RJO94708.1 DNA-binding protein [Exiguobacterium sp. RIT452]